jgi:hypothetical protein
MLSRHGDWNPQDIESLRIGVAVGVPRYLPVHFANAKDAEQS